MNFRKRYLQLDLELGELLKAKEKASLQEPLLKILERYKKVANKDLVVVLILETVKAVSTTLRK
jgi:hypothetical protein